MTPRLGTLTVVVLAVWLAACGSGDPAPEVPESIVVDTPQGELRITLAATTPTSTAASTSSGGTTGATAPDSTSTTTAAPAGSDTTAPPSAARLVDPSRLVVGAEVWGGYDRDLFPHWIDADGDGCDTRQEVLIRDSDTEVVLHPERVCRVVAGRWWSAYDDAWTTNPAHLHIDHLVPLAEAWESGARLWSAEQREAFANAEDGLVAVSASSNMAKAASDPAGWLPPNEDVWCVYVAVWIEVKATWGLSADPDEIAVLESLAEVCG